MGIPFSNASEGGFIEEELNKKGWKIVHIIGKRRVRVPGAERNPSVGRGL
jgi:hypothetical protein